MVYLRLSHLEPRGSCVGICMEVVEAAVRNTLRDCVLENRSASLVLRSGLTRKVSMITLVLG